MLGLVRYKRERVGWGVGEKVSTGLAFYMKKQTRIKQTLMIVKLIAFPKGGCVFIQNIF